MMADRRSMDEPHNPARATGRDSLQVLT